jgi:DNA-binding CsgD family transcriptional regulator
MRKITGQDAGVQAVCTSPLWNDVTARLCQALSARIIGLFVHGFTAGEEGGEIAAGAGIEPAFIKTYHRLSACNPWFAMLRCSKPGTVAIGADLVPPWELVRTAFYKSWLRPLNLRHSLIGTVLRDSDEAVFLTALRAPSQAPFGRMEAEMLGLVLPALGSTAHFAAELHALRNLADDLVAVLQACRETVMIVDGSGRPIILNPPAELVLSQSDGLVLSQGALSAAPGRGTTLLHGLTVGPANDRPRPDESTRLFTGNVLISRPSGKPPLLTHIMKLRHPLTDKSGYRSPAVALIGRSPDAAETSDLLRRHYGLTPAEVRLAMLIVSGNSLLQAAAEMKIKHNTARTHMKRVYAKTDTRRQVDLVRLFG